MNLHPFPLRQMTNKDTNVPRRRGEINFYSFFRSECELELDVSVYFFEPISHSNKSKREGNREKEKEK